MKIDKKWIIVTHMAANYKINEVQIYLRKQSNRQVRLNCDKILFKRYVTK
jgi:hypothetical protein